MQAALEFAPLLAFILAYQMRGLYAATGVLMVAMLGLLAADWLRLRRIPAMHALSTALVFAFGAATLLLHDRHFIQWKPTVFFWLASLAFLGSFWFGSRTLTERLLGAALAGNAVVGAATWRVLNALWVIFYAALGALNLVIAYNAPEHVWVNFKVFGLTLLTLAFVLAQVLWLARRGSATTAAGPEAR